MFKFTVQFDFFVKICMNNLNNGKFSGILFLDIRKCFDSISHEILLNKLKVFGICHKEHDWFTSYLVGRQQATICGEDMSSFATVKSGIPQGSALGPTLSLIFLNDLPLCQTDLHLNLYADDTAGSCSGNSVEDVIRKLQNGLNDISVWFSNNNLSINVEKSNFMIISSQYKVSNLNNHTSTLNLDGKVLHQIDNISYLGIHINEKLCWKPHVNQLCKKLGKKLGTLSRLRHVLPRESLILIYMATIQSVIDYGITIWGSAPKYLINKVQKFQNRAARLISNNFNYDIPGSQIVAQLGWQNIDVRRKYLTNILTYKCLNNQAPSYLRNMSLRSDTHGYETRHASSRKLSVPKPNIEKYREAFVYQAPKLWNELPKSISEKMSLFSFKSALKMHFNHIT